MQTSAGQPIFPWIVFGQEISFGKVYAFLDLTGLQITIQLPILQCAFLCPSVTASKHIGCRKQIISILCNDKYSDKFWTPKHCFKLNLTHGCHSASEGSKACDSLLDFTTASPLTLLTTQRWLFPLPAADHCASVRPIQAWTGTANETNGMQYPPSAEAIGHV